MNNVPQLPKGHTSILSPRFKYVPAVATDVAQTFARVRGRRLQIPRSSLQIERIGVARNEPEFQIDVLEASWLSRRPPSMADRRKS